jgi:hypothetical protein
MARIVPGAIVAAIAIGLPSGPSVVASTVCTTIAIGLPSGPSVVASTVCTTIAIGLPSGPSIVASAIVATIAIGLPSTLLGAGCHGGKDHHLSWSWEIGQGVKVYSSSDRGIRDDDETSVYV